MSVRSIFDAGFEFHVVVGGLHPDPIELKPHMIAMIAALGDSVIAHQSPLPSDD